MQDVIEKADAHSPVLHNLRNPVPIEREVIFTNAKKKPSEPS